MLAFGTNREGSRTGGPRVGGESAGGGGVEALLAQGEQVVGVQPLHVRRHLRRPVLGNTATQMSTVCATMVLTACHSCGVLTARVVQ